MGCLKEPIQCKILRNSQNITYWLNVHYSFSRKEQKIKHSLVKSNYIRDQCGCTLMIQVNSVQVHFRFCDVVQKRQKWKCPKIVILKQEFCYYLGSGKSELQFPGKNWSYFTLVTECQFFCLHWRVTQCQSHIEGCSNTVGMFVCIFRTQWGTECEIRTLFPMKSRQQRASVYSVRRPLGTPEKSHP